MAKKPTKPRPQTIRQTPTAPDDFARLRGNAAELARWLGTSASAISQGIDSGRFRPDAAGLFWLRRTVAAYCIQLREARAQDAAAADQRAELDYWKTQKLRQEVLEGRQAIAEKVADNILGKLRVACARMREACANHPETAAAIRALADELEREGAAQDIDPADTESDTKNETNDDDPNDRR